MSLRFNTHLCKFRILFNNTAFILLIVFVSFVHAAVLCGMNELEKQHVKGTKKHKKSNSKVRTTNELPLVKKAPSLRVKLSSSFISTLKL